MDENKLAEILNKSNNFDEFKANILLNKSRNTININNVEKNKKYYFSYEHSFIHSYNKEYCIEFYGLKDKYKDFVRKDRSFNYFPSFKNGDFYFYNNNFYNSKNPYEKTVSIDDIKEMNIPFKPEDFSKENWLNTLKKLMGLYPHERNSIDNFYFVFGEILLQFSFNNYFEKVKEKDLLFIEVARKQVLSIEDILQANIHSIFLWHNGEQTDPIWIKYIKENIIPEISNTK